MKTSKDEHWMDRCLELAKKGVGRVSPNPMVGCVILGKGDTVLAEGWHRGPGTAHAEKDALQKMGMTAPGATMYVNLEPCRHTVNRRTEPCAPLIIAAGIRRLVVGGRDPYPGHGGSLRAIKKAGIEVCVGVLPKDCQNLNRFFMHWATTKLPYTVWKSAISLDGKTVTRNRENPWITGVKARKDGRRLRGEMDVICVGIGTVLQDNPQLTTRLRGHRDPIRLIVDSQLKTPLSAKVLPANTSSKASCIIATTQGASARREKKLLSAGALVWKVSAGLRVSLPALWRLLGKHDYTSVLLEGGATLGSSAASKNLVDEILLYQSPQIIGGASKREFSWIVGNQRWRKQFRYAEAPTLIGADTKTRLIKKA